MTWIIAIIVLVFLTAMAGLYLFGRRKHSQRCHVALSDKELYCSHCRGNVFDRQKLMERHSPAKGAIAYICSFCGNVQLFKNPKEKIFKEIKNEDPLALD